MLEWLVTLKELTDPSIAGGVAIAHKSWHLQIAGMQEMNKTFMEPATGLLRFLFWIELCSLLWVYVKSLALRS